MDCSGTRRLLVLEAGLILQLRPPRMLPLKGFPWNFLVRHTYTGSTSRSPIRIHVRYSTILLHVHIVPSRSQAGPESPRPHVQTLPILTARAQFQLSFAFAPPNQFTLSLQYSKSMVSGIRVYNSCMTTSLVRPRARARRASSRDQERTYTRS
eukprot:COSAG02_NODE_13007_length_1461_cov_1.774596_2_plen_153_part_00